MILNFSVENFHGIKNRNVIDFTASADRSLSDRLITAGRKNVLPAVILYGENSSGKTTVLKALMTMREMVCGKYSHLFKGSRLPFEPFALAGEKQVPTVFETEFIYEDVRYLYGFSYNAEKILSEKLYYWPNGREALVFSRDESGYAFRDNVPEQNALAGRTADNRLYLTSSNEWNCENTEKAFRWFTKMIFCMNPDGFERVQDTAQETAASRILSELSAADPSICDILFSGKSGEISDIVYSVSDGAKFTVSMEKQSYGFRRYYRLISIWMNAFSTGSLIILDGLENGLSRKLTRHLAELIQDPKTNPNHAQLLCTTHDTYLMDQTLLRRDQIYVVEKSATSCCTEIRPLTYFSPRKDKRLDLGYLNGDYRIEFENE